MPVYEVDPLRDPRWVELLERDARASVFHTPGWLRSLRRTYGYEPVVLTTCAPRKDLTNGIVFCRVKSWLTGRRLVSLPFSDHCEPLLADRRDMNELVFYLQNEIRNSQLKYVEIRPLTSLADAHSGFCESKSYFFHKLDLRPNTDQIFRSFHKDSIQRKIQRARREGLTYEKGANRLLLEKFYRVFVMTRKRHGLPPPPFHWLLNLLQFLRGNMEVRIASKDDRPVAGMISLTYKNAIVYKYGGSDMRMSNLGGMALLFWMAILEAKAEGLQELDLGRCDADNPGLIRYKDRWGSAKSVLSYWRLPVNSAQASSSRWTLQLARRIFPYAPDPLRIAMGNLLYKHVG